MKTNKWTLVLAVASLFAACQKDIDRAGTAINQGNGTNSSVAGATASQNAQSVMVTTNVTAGSLDGSISYSFNPQTVVSYFTGTTNNGFLTQAALANKCNFLNGNTLQSFTVTNTRTGAILATITPVDVTNPPAAHTGWTRDDQSSVAPTDISITVTAESYNANLKKYSFSIADRITGLTLTINDNSGNTVQTFSQDDYTLGVNYVAEDGNTFYDDGGKNEFGSPTAKLKLINAQTIGYIIGQSLKPQHQIVSSGNAGLATAFASASLAPGDYTYTLTGTVKGNLADGSSNQGFSITNNLTIDGLGACTLDIPW